MTGLEKILLSSGMLIFPWLASGILYAISLNPGFDIYNQALSELGARGSATEFISPAINNYPVGILFIFFGLGLLSYLKKNKLAIASGALLATHGLSSIFAGIFSCDPGCPHFSGSVSQLLHTTAGLFMFGSLCFACILWFRIAQTRYPGKKFGLFSLLCALLALTFLFMAFAGFLLGSYAGLFEILSYGTLCLWCFSLSYVMLIKSRHANCLIKTHSKNRKHDANQIN